MFLLYLIDGIGANEYKIRLKIKGNTDTISYLVSYYGDKIVPVDTSINDKGMIVFQGDKNLPGGLYMLIGQDRNKVLEFVIDRDQNFTIVTDLLDPNEKASIKGSEENQLFFEYLQYSTAKHNEIIKLQETIRDPDFPKDSLKKTRTSIKEINKDVVNYKLNFLEQHPDHILSAVFSLIREIPVQTGPEDSDSLARYLFYKTHYWDGIELADARLIRTPVFYKKLNNYFDNVIPRHPDSTINEIDRVLYLAQNDHEMTQYIIWYLIEKYDNPKLMGFDKVFVHLSDVYFINDTLFDATVSVRESLIARAEKIKPLLLGKIPPNLIMLNPSGGFSSLGSITGNYTIIYFYDYDCGVCGKETKTLHSITDTIQFNIQVFAVCTDTNLSKWKEYVDVKQPNWMHVNGTRSITADYHELYDIYGTPVIYLLNEKKEIIAKRISAENIVPFLEHYERMYKRE